MKKRITPVTFHYLLITGGFQDFFCVIFFWRAVLRHSCEPMHERQAKKTSGFFEKIGGQRTKNQQQKVKNRQDKQKKFIW